MDVMEWLTVEEVADRCKVKPCTVRGWLLRKKLRKYKAHGRVLIAVADLAAFIKPDADSPGHTQAVV